jgi:hypothetical protein
MPKALILASLLLGCGQPDRETAPPALAAAPPAKPTAPPSILSDAVRDTVCKTEPCGGEESSIRIYRDGAGTVKKLYRLYGPCSHNPGIYFDPDGAQTEVIPEKPIVPGSDEAKEFEAKHDKQVGGLTHTDTIRCRDGARLAP